MEYEAGLCEGSEVSVTLKLVDPDQDLIDAALAIAEERENTTRNLARAVLNQDFVEAEKLAKELLPNEAGNRTHSRVNRVASR